MDDTNNTIAQDTLEKKIENQTPVPAEKPSPAPPKTEDNELRCDECGGRLVKEISTGEMICEECGLVSTEVQIDPGKDYRQFDPEDASKQHDGIVDPLRHDKGLGSEIKGNRDAYGKRVDGRKSYTLQKWNRRAKVANAFERNLAFSMQQLNTYKSHANLSDKVHSAAAEIYKKAMRRGFVRGRSIEGVLSAAIVAGTRIEGVPRTFDEIADLTKVPRKYIATIYKDLIRELKIKIDTASPMNYVSRFCSDLGLKDPRVLNETNYILCELDKLGHLSGRSPPAIAAATIYIASVIQHQRRTQRECADIGGATEVTIRNRYKEILEFLPEINQRFQDAGGTG